MSTRAAASPVTTPSLAVVVPTYRRPRELLRCLTALQEQSMTPAELVVVRREGDQETSGLLSDRFRQTVTEVAVRQPGVLAALVAGVRATRGTVIAFTDDDAVPRENWLEQLLPHFADPKVGAAGGRDVVHPRDECGEPLMADVGRVTPWGKLIGNHHLAQGRPRAVTVLKGVNMAFRREALVFPSYLRGQGAQVHYELYMCMIASRRGWKLILDPGAVVDHFVGPRFDEQRREGASRTAIRDEAYNLVASMLAAEPALFWRRAVFGLLVGDAASPGIGRALLSIATGERGVTRGLTPSLAGQTRALRDFMVGQRPEPITIVAEEAAGAPPVL
jgi:glycosyltransferase involved in cell wall biosynthesis